MMYCSSLQVRDLLGVFRTAAARVEAYITFLFRITDIQNEKVFRGRIDDPDDKSRLRARLGDVGCFPFIQPEQAIFICDFAIYEQRFVAWLLFTLSSKEARENLRDFSYVNGEGVPDPLPQGVPRTWDF